MKKWFVLLCTAMLLAGCVPNFNQQDEIVQESEESNKKSIVPNYQISDSHYRSIIPFQPSKSRGMVVSNLHTSYDIEEFELGLMRVAKEHFSTNRYLFQEGQILDQDTIKSWLARKYTPEQMEEREMEEADNLGLNPPNDGKGTVEEQNEKNPIYLAHILEHNYLVRNDQTVRLGGIVIGLALNSVHYYQKERYGATYEQKIDHETLDREGKKIADEILNRLRSMKEVGDVPITIALFEQNSRNAVIPGNFFAYAHASKGSNSLGDWVPINEQYYLFPSSKAEDEHRDDLAYFLRFKDDVEKYFPNYSGVIGRAFYKNDQLIDLNIEINIQFRGEAEVIGFTQWATSLVLDHFPEYINVEVNIQSIHGPEALIVRESGTKEPFVYVY